MKNAFIIATVSLILISGCASVTKQPKNLKILDASQEDTLGGTGASSADIRSMAERMAREIAGINWADQKTKRRIALTSIENETRFALNPNLIKDKLLGDLIELASNSGISYTENITNADYTLTARITALSKGTSEGVSDYLLYSFRLTDHEDTVIWMKSYETKKQGKTGVMYR